MPEPSLLDYIQIVVRRRRLFLLCVAASLAATLGVTLLLPKIYRAEATIFVRPQATPLGGVLGQVSLPLPGLTGSGSVPFVLAVLNSRALAAAVVQQVNFPSPPRRMASASVVQSPDSYDPRVRLLREMLKPREKSGLVTIAIEGRDPILATELANAYVQLLDRFLQKSTTKKREFIERQLVGARADLSAAEEALLAFQKGAGTIAITVETEETVKAMVALETELLKLDAIVAENANMLRESGQLVEIDALQTQRAGLQARQAELRRQYRQWQARARNVPTQVLAFARLQRDVELQLRRYTLLLEQQQLASISEQQEEAIFQTVDIAEVPRGPARPRLVINLLLGAFVGAVVGAGSAISLEERRPRTSPADGSRAVSG